MEVPEVLQLIVAEDMPVQVDTVAVEVVIGIIILVPVVVVVIVVVEVVIFVAREGEEVRIIPEATKVIQAEQILVMAELLSVGK